MKNRLSRFLLSILVLVLVPAICIPASAAGTVDMGVNGQLGMIYTVETCNTGITYRQAKGNLTNIKKLLTAALTDIVGQADYYYDTGEPEVFLQRIGNWMLVKDTLIWAFGDEKENMGFGIAVPLEAETGYLAIMLPFAAPDEMCVQANLFYGWKDALPDVAEVFEKDDLLEVLKECAKKYPGVEFYKNGASPETIKKVQEALNNAGYACGTADGKIGKNTRAAIKEYRKVFGLEEGDFISDDLLESMGLNAKQTASEEPVTEEVTEELPAIPEGDEAITVRVYGQPVTVTKDTTDTFREKMLALGGEMFYDEMDEDIGFYAMGFAFENGAVFGNAEAKGAALTDVSVFANSGSTGLFSYRTVITDATTKEDLDAVNPDFWDDDGIWKAKIATDGGYAVIWVWYDAGKICFDLFFEPSDGSVAGAPVAETPVTAEPAASDTDAGWVCEACGTAGLTGKFCIECGAPKPEPKDWTCPTCGKTGLESNFCTECGTKKPE